MRLSQSLKLSALALFASAIAPNVHADARTFRNPAFEGYRLDYCTASGRVCGERVATEWCVSQGYEYASDWGVDREVGLLNPTMRMDNGSVCRGEQCSAFTAITCGREEQVFVAPGLASNTRDTVFRPDRRLPAVAVTRMEREVTVPGCSQYEPGSLLCRTAADFQYCRSLIHEGIVWGCRLPPMLEEAPADFHEAVASEYDLSVRARAAVAVERGSRGDGRIRGDTRYELALAIPGSNDICTERDHYEYQRSGPDGGSSISLGSGACDAPLQGRFRPHGDDLIHGYDLCEARSAWGGRVEITTDRVVAAVFHYRAPVSSALARDGSRSAYYVVVSAPLEVDCRS